MLKSAQHIRAVIYKRIYDDNVLRVVEHTDHGLHKELAELERIHGGSGGSAKQRALVADDKLARRERMELDGRAVRIRVVRSKQRADATEEERGRPSQLKEQRKYHGSGSQKAVPQAVKVLSHTCRAKACSFPKFSPQVPPHLRPSSAKHDFTFTPRHPMPACMPVWSKLLRSQTSQWPPMALRATIRRITTRSANATTATGAVEARPFSMAAVRIRKGIWDVRSLREFLSPVACAFH